MEQLEEFTYEIIGLDLYDDVTIDLIYNARFDIFLERKYEFRDVIVNGNRIQFELWRNYTTNLDKIIQININEYCILANYDADHSTYFIEIYKTADGESTYYVDLLKEMKEGNMRHEPEFGSVRLADFMKSNTKSSRK